MASLFSRHVAMQSAHPILSPEDAITQVTQPDATSVSRHRHSRHSDSPSLSMVQSIITQSQQSSSSASPSPQSTSLQQKVLAASIASVFPNPLAKEKEKDTKAMKSFAPIVIKAGTAPSSVVALQTLPPIALASQQQQQQQNLLSQQQQQQQQQNSGNNSNSGNASHRHRSSPIPASQSLPSLARALLPPQSGSAKGKYTIILDLDETLVHSSFKPVPNPTVVLPITLDGIGYNVYVNIRPFAAELLLALSLCYEVVIFTASLDQYANPVIDYLDKHQVVSHRLFRDSCSFINGHYVKDLDILGRNSKRVIIVDNSPLCYELHPANAISVSTWFSAQDDNELSELCERLTDTNFLSKEDAIVAIKESQSPSPGIPPAKRRSSKD